MSAGGNSTTSHEAPYLQKYWLVCESLFVVLTFVALYLAVRLTKFAFEKTSNRQTGREISQKIWLKRLCAVSSIGLVLRLIADHIAAFLSWQSDELCLATITASSVMFCFALYPIYFFLWVRQSIFYTNPVIRQSLNPAVTRISYGTLVLMIVAAVTMPILYNTPQITGWVYSATKDGCKDISEDTPEIAPGIVITLTILFQLVLLALFIYPLLSKEMAKFRAPTVRSPSKSPDNFKSSTLSKSDETRRQDSEQDEYHDDAFYPPSSRPGSPLVRPISPLARNGHNFTFERTPKASETDNEGAGFPDYANRNQSRREFSAGSQYYHYRAPNYSVSSDNGSPAVSDSEQSRSKGNTMFGTIRHKFRKSSRQTKRNNEEKEKRKEGRKLLKLMKNYSKLVAFCIITDGIFAGIQIAIVLQELINLLLFDINLLINLLCIVMTYKEWPAIIFPGLDNSTQGETRRSTTRLRRTATPPRKTGRPDRVQELKLEGKKERAKSPDHRSSGSGYDSGDSSCRIYRGAENVSWAKRLMSR